MEQYGNGPMDMQVEQTDKKMPTWMTIVLWLVFTALVAGLTYYFVNKKATTDKKNLQTQIDDLNKKIATTTGATSATTTTSAATDPTAGWKTVTDKKYGVSLKYPATWNVTDNSFNKASTDPADFELLKMDFSSITFDIGKNYSDSDKQKRSAYMNVSKISALKAASTRESDDADKLLAVYSSRSASNLVTAIWLPPSNAAIQAFTKSEYIESLDGKFRGVAYFASISQDLGTNLDSMIVLTDGTYVFQIHVLDGSSKSSNYDMSGSNAETISNQYKNYVKTLTSKSTGEEIIDEFNLTYQYIAKSVTR